MFTPCSAYPGWKHTAGMGLSKTSPIASKEGVGKKGDSDRKSRQMSVATK